MSDDVVFDLHLDASPEEVFRLLTEQELLRRWMPVTVFEPWLGGRFELEARGMVAVGSVTRIEPPQVVAYSWDWRDFPLPAPTEVTITLTPRDAGTWLRLSHAGLSAEQRAGFAQGWNYYLPRLRAAGQTGGAGPDTFATGAS